MTKFLLVATIASLSIVNAGFAWAQEAISEPGSYAFTIPMATCCTPDPANTVHTSNPWE